jgi:hypothetical protein
VGESLGSGKPLASAQANSQLWQPTQRDASYKIPWNSTSLSNLAAAFSLVPAANATPVSPSTLKEAPSIYLHNFIFLVKLVFLVKI